MQIVQCPKSVLVGKKTRPSGVHSTYVIVDERRYDLVTSMASLSLWFSELTFEGQKNLVKFLEKQRSSLTRPPLIFERDSRKSEVRIVVLPERTLFEFYPFD